MTSTNKLDPIPHPPKKPVVGNMLSLDSTAPVQHLTRLVKELERIGDIIRVPAGRSAGTVRQAVLECWELVLSGRLDEARELIPE